MFTGKTVLITGGTGSFGNAIVHRLFQTGAREIRIFSRDEVKQDEMRKEFDSIRLRFYLGDVREYDTIFSAMKGVDYVFHAAALKQVPSCEIHPIEAVKTNILGTENVLNAAIARNVRRVVVLSTDKAVYPINAMGISKAMAEKLTIAKARHAGETVLSITRYGNVMGSRGSVIPLFISQIKQGIPITITNPDMTRFLMSLDDAVDLVFCAFQNAKQGDIFVQKSAAATVMTLAQALVELFNAKSGIKIVGSRQGDKLHESLLSHEEMGRAGDMGSYYRVKDEVGAVSLQDYNSSNAGILDVSQVKELLMKQDFIKDNL